MIIQKAGNTTDLTLNGTTSVNGSLNLPSANTTFFAVFNADTANVVFIKFGYGNAPTAAATDLPIPPNQYIGVDAGAGATHVAVVCVAASTAHVYVTPCYGDSRM